MHVYVHACTCILEYSCKIMTPLNVDFSPPCHVQGCPSWKWFYPYHYAPFASDFKDITKVRNDFDQGTVPFAPLEQLMGVFPASSGKFLPLSWRQLMMKDVRLTTHISLNIIIC